MPTPKELEEKFWKELKSDRTIMLGLRSGAESHSRPMTVQLDGDRGPLWIFTAKDTELAGQLGSASKPAFATFVSKGHGLFASMQGQLQIDTNRAMVDKLWNKYVAAWFEGGKDDPKLALLRFDAEHAEIWEDASSLISGLKLLLGMDPKEEYKDKVADVSLRH